MLTKEDEYINCLATHIATRLECHAALIRSADDPMAMLRVLRPILVHPEVNGGEIPPMYRRIAEEEIRKRAAMTSSTTQH